MRIWSIHPKYLDARGLVALWRETLLAKRVLQGRTKGYRHHPQLIRFKASRRPIDCIDRYLAGVYLEAVKRGYNFDRSKIGWDFVSNKLSVTRGQLKYERSHLLKKMKVRDGRRYSELMKEKDFKPHPLFRIRNGGIEEWEVR
jgi:hypothetical protein